MRTLEELDKEYAEKRVALEREHEIAKALPAAPYMIHFATKTPWIVYKVETFVDALALMSLFHERLPYVNAKGLFRWICPLEMVKEEDGAFTACVESSGAPFINAEAYPTHSEVELVFYVTLVTGQIGRVIIRPKCYPASLRPVLRYASPTSERVVAKTYSYIPGADTVKWNVGRDAAKASYVWYTDDDFAAAMELLLKE